jgi:hypothetical protein
MILLSFLKYVLKPKIENYLPAVKKVKEFSGGLVFVLPGLTTV